MEEGNTPRLYRLDQTVGFGKHKGKTIREIYFGFDNIPEKDLTVMAIDFHNKQVPTSDRIYGPWSQLYKKDREESMSEGLKALIRYQPDPSYIGWLIANTEITITINDFEYLQKKAVKILTKFKNWKVNEDTWDFSPVFESIVHKFPSEIKDTLKHKIYQIREERRTSYNSASEDKSDWEKNSDSLESDGICIACHNEMPCFCSYYINQT